MQKIRQQLRQWEKNIYELFGDHENACMYLMLTWKEKMKMLFMLLFSLEFRKWIYRYAYHKQCNANALLLQVSLKRYFSTDFVSDS